MSLETHLATPLFRKIAVCGLALLISACDTPEPPAEELPRASVAPLGSLLVPYEYTVSAQALSVNDSQLSAQITAPVIEVPVDVGATVEPGQTIITLDCRDAKNRLQETRAALTSLSSQEKLARQQFERAQKLRQQQSVSEEDMNRRESELAAAIANREVQAARQAIAERDVDHCQIKAPFKGVVTERYAQVGQMANTGAPMVRIVDMENLEVSANIVTDDVDSLLKTESPVFVTRNENYPVLLRAIAGAIDTRTRTQQARLLFTGDKPIPGATGKLVWRDVRRVLPAHIVSRRSGQLGVLIAKDGKADFYPLPGAREGQPAFVDLPPDTPVVTDGRFSLSHGDAFQLIEPATPASDK